MSLSNISQPASFGHGSSISRNFYILIWAATLAVGAVFLLRNVPEYFVFTQESYGNYYWPRAGYLFPHIVGGLIAMVIGPFQFWPRIRNGYPKVHRTMGRIYLIAIVVGAVGGMVMAATSARSFAYGVGLFSLGVVWLLTSGMAFAAIRRRNFVQHKQWMIRSYVVTFAFVTFRIGNNLMTYYGIGEQRDRGAVLAWACWAVPLLITELVLQGRQVFASRARETT